MSGSSGGGGGDIFVIDTIQCDSLVINTQLSSPKADIVRRLTKGDELTVVLEKYATGQVVVVAKHNGDITGGLTAPETARLRACMEQGTSYNATVLEVNGGQVRVRVHPA